jgi:hypothetical protein
MMSKTTGEMLIELHKAKSIRDEADELVESLTAQLVEAMKVEGQQSLKVRDDENAITGTLVEAIRIVIDEARLKKELGAQKWGKVTKQVLDKPKLEDAITKGEVDPNVVAICSEEKANKPYVKVTAKALVQRTRKPSEAARRVRKKQ